MKNRETQRSRRKGTSGTRLHARAALSKSRSISQRKRRNQFKLIECKPAIGKAVGNPEKRESKPGSGSETGNPEKEGS